MKTNLSLSTADVVTLLIILALMIGGVRIVIGFFHTGKHKNLTNSYNGKGLLQMTLLVDGMQCGECEMHVNNAIRKNFPVEKVRSSATKGETVILTKQDIPDQALTEVIGEGGYTVKEIFRENAKRKFA